MLRDIIKPFFLITIILIAIFPILDTTFISHGYSNTVVLVAESPASLVEYIHQVREGIYRFILTNNPERIANLLSNNGLLFKILNKSRGDEIIRGMNPHELAYTLLYASRLGRGIRVEELPLLSEHVREFEIQLLRGKSNVSVVFFSSDGSDYAFLAAYTAILKEASLIDMDAGFDPSYLRGVEDVIVVTTPLWRGNSDRYSKLINYFTKLDEDPYLDVSFGLLTGNYLETPFMMLLSDVILERAGLQAFLGISLIEDLPITRKVERISSILGLHPKVYYPDLSYSNLTEEVVKSLLNVRRSLIYLSLHGNPYTMALRYDGYPVMTAHTVKQLDVFGSIIITLSCNTLKFSDISGPESSVAYSFLDSGALAYVGSTKAEFSLKSEFGTSHPDLLILLLMSGNSLGEAVKIVNNLKIGSSAGQTIESASEVLLGDPTLRIQGMRLPFKTSGGSGRYVIEVEETTPTLFLMLREVGNPSIVSEVPEPHFEWYRDDEGTFIYITTLSTSYAGYFKAGDRIEVKMGKSEGSASILPYFLILSVMVISLIPMLRHR
ncbi:MAG: C25 family cysteine peptidase [Candidatus Korarchaeum sp.]